MEMIIDGSRTPLNSLDDIASVRRRETAAAVTTTRARRFRMSVERAPLSVIGGPSEFDIGVRGRESVPAYTMKDYKLRGILYGAGDIPLERREVALPALAPGAEATVRLKFAVTAPRRIEFDVLRPTRFSAYTHVWHP
jgi:hypothetical protein